jgi:hypothetical protein
MIIALQLPGIRDQYCSGPRVGELFGPEPTQTQTYVETGQDLGQIPLPYPWCLPGFGGMEAAWEWAAPPPLGRTMQCPVVKWASMLCKIAVLGYCV